MALPGGTRVCASETLGAEGVGGIRQEAFR